MACQPVQTLAPSAPPSSDVLFKKPHYSMSQFYDDIRSKFRDPLRPDVLRSVSLKLRNQFEERLQNDDMCMLPSFNHILPRGDEKGVYLALDMGGSTFRVALVQLRGGCLGDGAMHIIRQQDFRIGDGVRTLSSDNFFAWIADKIHETLSIGCERWLRRDRPLSMGLAWSFPVEQKSINSAKILLMGKGFHSMADLRGKNLATLLTQACRARHLNVELDAIVNDSSATLLTRAYLASCTRIALILGTGLNAAVHLPCSKLGREKFGDRPAEWLDQASHVVVNSELSMFGKGVFPTTKWDDILNKSHSNPDFQPLEYLVSGRYIGEIVRIILSEAIQTAKLFDGEVPVNFGPYELSAETIAIVEADHSPGLTIASAFLQQHHPLPSGKSFGHYHLQHMQKIIQLVSTRAAAYAATSIHALWVLRCEAEGETVEDTDDLCIGYNGSILEKYPRYKERMQEWLDILTGPGLTVRLELAKESSLLGAAVAVCCETGPASPNT